MKSSSLALLSLLANNAFANDVVKYRINRSPYVKRQVQETVAEGGICDTMIPPSLLPPDDSTCWQWWTPPTDGVMKPGMPTPPKGCDYSPCESAVCDCDSYCCETAWDLSCRGYHLDPADTIDNNYFIEGCSAKLLCCEPESAYPDPPVGGAMPPAETQSSVDETSCTPKTDTDCCATMMPPSYFPPDDSTCWQWWEPPADGVVKAGSPIPPKGCDYTPCENAVCDCDSYCCETAWDLSCRGYHLDPADTVDNNYFVDGCSAKLLCCEPESAYPDPPVGGASGSKSITTATIKKDTTVIQTGQTDTTVKILPVTTAQKVPVQVIEVVPVTTSQIVTIPVATKTTGGAEATTWNVGVNVEETDKKIVTTETEKASSIATGTAITYTDTINTVIIQQVTVKGSKKSCKKGKSGKAKGKSGKSGKKGSSKGSKSSSSSSKSKSKKSSKCTDFTSAPTPPVGSPTLSPTETSTSTSTSTSTASLSGSSTSNASSSGSSTSTSTASALP